MESLAGDIDALNNRLTYCILVIGSAAVLVNPVFGLSIVALKHVYKECMADPTKQRETDLGSEDIRWLSVLFKSIEGGANSISTFYNNLLF